MNLGRTGEREAVLEILTRIRESGDYSHIAVKEVLDRCEREGMDRRQRAFVKRLTEGVIERRIELDDVIRKYTKKGVRIKPVVRDILRMGIFQILYMDAVPDSAACNEAVKLTKASGKKEVAGFVNGILRNVARGKDILASVQAPSMSMQSPSEDGAGVGEVENGTAASFGVTSPSGITSLSRKYSMPEWIIRMWNRQFSPEETEKLLASFLEVRPVTIRFDDRITEEQRDSILSQFTQLGVGVRKGHYLPYCYELTGTDSISKLPGYREGSWTVQDESSMMVAEAAGLTGGETVYDVCAAPGGKATHCAGKLLAIAETGGNAETAAPGFGTVHAFDLSKGKVTLIEKSARRMRLSNLIAEQRDALAPVPEEEKGKADVLLCDLPCSGLGVIGRKRDIKYHVSGKQLEELHELQKEILTNVVQYLKEGGTLIYSTCTINRGENEEIAEFIEKELGFEPDPLASHLPAGIPGIEEGPEGNRLQMLPHVHGTDGFFLARFKKA